MKQIFLPILGTFCFILIVGFLFSNPGKFTQTNNFSVNNQVGNVITVNGTKINIFLAQTPEQRSEGLSKTESLKENEGMLFVFDKKDTKPSFWMKNMLFPIDIIWINDKKVIQIDTNVPVPPKDTPDNKLETYSPTTEIDYVLEVNAGFCKDNNIKLGSKVDLSSLEN